MFTLLLALAWSLGVRRPIAPESIVDAALLERGSDGVLRWRGQPFTGTTVRYHPGASRPIAETTELRTGLRHGTRLRWHANGRLESRTQYQRGRLHGVGESFWDNGNRRSKASYHEGRTHGVSTQWYREGMRFKERHLVDGKEVGLQRAWRRNGKLYANYEAVAGRNYGRQQSALCFEVATQ